MLAMLPFPGSNGTGLVRITVRSGCAPVSALLLNETLDVTTIAFAIFVVVTVALSRKMPVRRYA